MLELALLLQAHYILVIYICQYVFMYNMYVISNSYKKAIILLNRLIGEFLPLSLKRYR